MIIKVAPGRVFGRGSFLTLAEYVEYEKSGQTREDLVASWSGLVANHSTAAIEMTAVARHSSERDLKDPVYHVVLSLRPGEYLSIEQAKSSVEAVRASLCAEDHQFLAAMHYDEPEQRYHVHVMINKVSINNRLLNRRHDFAKLARATEWCELEHGFQVDKHMAWRARLSEIHLWSVPDLKMAPPLAEKIAFKGTALSSSTAKRDAVHHTHYSWTKLIQEKAAPAALEAASRPGATWEQVHAVLRPFNLFLEARRRGARLVGFERGQHVKASDVGISIRKLERHLGPFVARQRNTVEDEARALRARRILASESSWDSLHRMLEDEGYVIERHGRGARIIDLTSAARHRLRRFDCRLMTLERRLGPYEPSPWIVARDERERERRAAGILEKIAALSSNPDVIIDRIAETRSVWTAEEIEAEVRSALGVKDGYTKSVCALVEVIARNCVQLAPDYYTQEGIRSEEEALFLAANVLASRRRQLPASEPASDLDEQQQAAFRHLTGQSDLAIVTGVAGAGKSRMLAAVSRAYRCNGYRVIGLAVSGAATRVLASEAGIACRTTAKFLSDCNNAYDKLSPRDVVIIDEASQLGSPQAKAILEHAKDKGARVLFIGDPAQHQSVARGAPLRGLIADHGAFDMGRTRRAKPDWMRKVAVDLRSGAVARALGILREKGAVQEYERSDEAKAALVSAFVQSKVNGLDALLVATRNEDVFDLSCLVRRSIHDELGEERPYQTAFGKRAFAVGDLLVARERAYDGVNGDLYHVIAHRDDAEIELRRLSDQQRVIWDVSMFGAIDYGYATTSYRSQGRTVDSVLVLASAADSRPGMYIDVTRARETITVAYGRDEIEDFSELLLKTQRTYEKALIRDALTFTEMAQKRHRNASIPQLHEVRVEQRATMPKERYEVIRVMSVDPYMAGSSNLLVEMWDDRRRQFDGLYDYRSLGDDAEPGQCYVVKIGATGERSIDALRTNRFRQARANQETMHYRER